jgi:hypothetical protein
MLNEIEHADLKQQIQRYRFDSDGARRFGDERRRLMRRVQHDLCRRRHLRYSSSIRSNDTSTIVDSLSLGRSHTDVACSMLCAPCSSAFESCVSGYSKKKPSSMVRS